MNLQEEINKINERVEAPNKDVQSLINELEEAMENEFPQDGPWYWYVTSDAGIGMGSWGEFEFEKEQLSIENIFRTREEAEFAVEKLKVEAELRKFSRPFKPMTNNFFIAYNAKVESLEIDCSLNTNIQGVIYFGSREELRRAVESVDKERVEKYIFGVED